MSNELIYTSVPRGLRPGTTGFCTVAMTARLPDALVERLESLSGYRAIYPLGDPQAANNPVVWAHWRVNVGDRPRTVLSRVAFAGADYSQRSNKFAHHVVIEPNEQSPAGPAWLLRHPGVMESEWDSEPCQLPTGRAIPRGDRPAAPCTAWQAATGDAGWAGVLAESFRSNPSKPSYLIFQPGMDMLPLMEEAIALLPEPMRWQVTFSTYFTELPMGATCAWRCVVAGTPAAKEAMRAGTRPIDLTKPMGAPPDGPMVEPARTGRAGAPATPASLPPIGGTTLKLRPENDEQALLAFHEKHQSSSSVSAPRRLGRSEVGYTVEEADADPLVLTVDDRIPQAAHQNPDPRRYQIRTWATLVFCAICLAGGAVGGYQLALQIKQMRDQHQSDEVVRLQLDNDKLSSGAEATKADESKTADELQRINETAADLRKNNSVLISENGELTTKLKTLRDKSAEDLGDLKTKLNAAHADISGLQTHVGEMKRKLAEVGPASKQALASIPTSDWLAKSADQLPLAPLTGPPLSLLAKPAGGTSGWWLPDQTWPFDGTEKIYLLFPNGTNQSRLKLGRLEADVTATGMTLTMIKPFLASTEPSSNKPAEKTSPIAEFRLQDNLLGMRWNSDPFKNNEELRAEVVDLLNHCTIAGSNNSNEWERLSSFGGVPSAEPGAPLNESITFTFTARPADFTLGIGNTGLEGWTVQLPGRKPEERRQVVLRKQRGGKSLPDIAFTVKCSVANGADGGISITLTTDWLQFKQAHYIKLFEQTKLEYGQLMSIGKPPKDPPIPPLDKITQDADVRQIKLQNEMEKLPGLVKERDKQKDRRKRTEMDARVEECNNAIKGCRPFITKREEVKKVLTEISEFENIGPIIGDLRLPNGRIIAKFKFSKPTGALLFGPT